MEIEALRKAYALAITSSRDTEYLLEELLNEELSNPLELAYLGATEALKAKHGRNPLRKLQFVNHAQDILGKAVSLSPVHVEIRFLRFSIQHNLPAFLKSHDHLKEDKEMILRHLGSYCQDRDMCRKIGRFLIDSGRCGSSEIERIKAILEDVEIG